MEKKVVSFDVEIKQLEELSSEERQLIDKAMESTRASYSPYSGFAVGAALQLANGKIFIGANQENAAFPSGLCAERTAIFAAQVNYPEVPIKMIAIAGRNKNGFLPTPISPCGGCRQVMIEVEHRYENHPVKIMLYGTKGIYVINSAKDLMPLSFIAERLYE